MKIIATFLRARMQILNKIGKNKSRTKNCCFGAKFKKNSIKNKV